MKPLSRFAAAFTLTFLAGAHNASATEYPLPPADSRLIGENTTYVVPNDGQVRRVQQSLEAQGARVPLRELLRGA